VQKLLQIGQINPRCVQLDVLQLLAMHSAREFYGLIVVHQAYLYEVKTLRPKNHLEWGRSVPGPARQPDLEFLEHHLLARRIPGQCPAGPPAALGGLDHLGGKQYLSFGPFISNVQGDLLDWQSPHPGVTYLQLRGQLRLIAKLGAFVGQMQEVDSMVLIVQVTALNRATPIEGWPRAADLSLRLHLTGQGCHA
jgi:hypothetical protein